MTPIRLQVSALLLALMAAGCASVNTAPPALVEARAAVRTAETNPDVLANAPLELRKATDTLARADRALADRAPDVEVNHAAYLATQRARTAIAVGTAKAGDDLIRTAQLERERIRSDARELEARRARTDAEIARADANAARSDASVARTDASVARANASIQREQTAIAQQQAFAATQDAANARDQASSAADLAAAAQAKAIAAEAQSEALTRQLAAMETLRTERGLVITLGDVLFEFNRADVRPTAATRLGQLAVFLREFPERRVLIEGHTDNVGSAEYNAELSRRRAEAIKAQLVVLGVEPDRITTVGYGKDYPVANNASETDRAINRRVEVVISNTADPVRARR